MTPSTRIIAVQINPKLLRLDPGAGEGKQPEHGAQDLDGTRARNAAGDDRGTLPFLTEPNTGLKID